MHMKVRHVVSYSSRYQFIYNLCNYCNVCYAMLSLKGEAWGISSEFKAELYVISHFVTGRLNVVVCTRGNKVSIFVFVFTIKRKLCAYFLWCADLFHINGLTQGCSNSIAITVFMKIIRHIRHFWWLGPNFWWEISHIWIEYIKPNR